MPERHDDIHERMPALLEPDTLLASQYFDRLRRRSEQRGERLLMIAILEDAVGIYRKHAGAHDARGRELFAETEEWIESPDGSWIFSFESICHVLGLEPGYLRRGLRAWKARVRQGRRHPAEVVSLAAEPAPLRKASGCD